MVSEFEKTMAQIVESIRSAGYEPYAQLYGYLTTGDETYITRTGDARTLIKDINHDQLQQYVAQLKHAM